ncbi:NHL repeat-containing protein [Cyclonatronum proteinivorum]|uniref:NHL repeat-containing protein n=1 Tax=Cyclonatronum proteinivorum TaxID=1457365 RepID=A0A345UNR7_9BACT|nr:hypothetical protein [Cyclonatronum proteinivorum]AXJ02119.1 NHL repeat-containing protein [Cyclonatronum proteinivorum]
MMKQVFTVLLLFVISAGFLISCEDMFGSKQDSITDEIFEDGRLDPNLIVEDVGYVALLPFWDTFNKPTDIFVGYDELVYVTDEDGLHVLDRAGRKYLTLSEAADFDISGSQAASLRNAVSVTQDRLLNVYVAARIDTVIAAVDPDITWNLPAVYKIRNANGAGPVELLQVMVHPFMDASRATAASQRNRLNRDIPDNDEFVEITGLSTLANNELYVTRRGPRNRTGEAITQDNTVLIMSPRSDNPALMRNTSQIRALNPNSPSLTSAIDLTDIASFATPPQRDNVPSDRSFLITQGSPDPDNPREIPFRVLWVNAVDTPDGIEYRSNPNLLNRDTTRARSFLYDQNRFTDPSGVAFSGDERAHLFVVDAARDSLYLFQSNGIEGVNPPAGSSATRAINVSFGGTGNGAREFDNPSGVAYFRRIVYVADTNNNRISRFRLNTDFE